VQRGLIRVPFGVRAYQITFSASGAMQRGTCRGVQLNALLKGCGVPRRTAIYGGQWAQVDMKRLVLR